jgi:hypothetical protein
MKSEFAEQFNQLTEVLVERGFAKPVSRDARGALEAIDLTKNGDALLKHLQQLFDIPNTKRTDLKDDHIVDLIKVLLLHSPRDKS